MEQIGGDISASQTGIMLSGISFLFIAMLVKFIGSSWIDWLLPPVVIGPMIMVIGL
ncbi:solute carrier family 23 protein [Salmonella enterica]|uniref:solute carrier family 23 protein n=1 Tax=Salmonella enterica TaxID=28901 RepID=UPI001BB0594D